MTARPAMVRLPMWLDPELVFRGWAARAADAFWLDAGPAATTGRSWVGIGEQVSPDDVRGAPVGRAESGPSAGGSGEDARGPLVGSCVGWFGYDAAAASAGAPSRLEEGSADAWLRVSAVVEFDHVRAVVHVHAHDAGALADELAALVSDGGTDAQSTDAQSTDAQSTDAQSTDAVTQPPLIVASARHGAAEYAGLIERCRDEIRQGNAYQLCLTTRFEVPGPVDAVAAYLRLRASVSAHHGGFIRIGERTLLSASPEQFVEVDGMRLRTHPIKGTRPRAIDPDVDGALAEELRADPKERAENVMIVDLMRNDLSRICRTGSVTVERLFEVESYPAVHQLVSTVAGDLTPGMRVADLLAASFPAGSMTGAPKLSAMTILHGLEGGPRGVFAGCFGWIGAQGELDLAMVIRSIVVAGDGAYVGAGGGITWLSRPDAEVAEVAVKARGPLAALGARVPDGWDGPAPVA